MDSLIRAPENLESQVPAFVAWARALSITTPEAFTDAAERLRAIKGALKGVADFFKPMKARADETKKAILDAEKRLAVPLQEAESSAKAAMLTYQRVEEAKRRAEERRLQEEADARARRDREALERKAAAAKRPETKERYAEQAAAVIAPVVAIAPTKVDGVDGVSTAKIWKARIVDQAAIPREYLQVDAKKLDRYAKAMREMASVPGVEFYVEEVMSARSR